MRTKFVVGSRGSRLAMVQAESVTAEIEKINPGLEISIARITTAGDRNRRTGLDRIGVAVFVKELEDALLNKKIDLAVHSLKDMPTAIPDGLALLAVTRRLDPRDALVAGAGLDAVAPGSSIGTGSLRRSAQLLRYRPDLKVAGIRGNVDTRLRKVTAGELDGIIIAAAAMLRLGLQDKITEYLPLDNFLPSAGQGALGIEARLDDMDVAGLVSPLNHIASWQSAMAERAFIHALGGGCRAPIAALGTVSGSNLKLEGMITSADGKKMLRASEEGSASSPEKVGTCLAQRMLDMGAAEFIAEISGR